MDGANPHVRSAWARLAESVRRLGTANLHKTFIPMGGAAWADWGQGHSGAVQPSGELAG